MSVPLADARGRLRSSRNAINRSTRAPAVQREKNHVRCAWRRRHARAARRDCDDARHTWRRRCPLSARPRSRDEACLPRTAIDRRDAVTRSRDDRRQTRAHTSTATIMPTCGARRVREPREGLAKDGRLRRRSSPDRDAGASRCPCDACILVARAGYRGDVRFLRRVDPCDEILPTRRHRSASRDPRRRLARIRIHPIRRGRVPARARARQGGAPA